PIQPAKIHAFYHLLYNFSPMKKIRRRSRTTIGCQAASAAKKPARATSAAPIVLIHHSESPSGSTLGGSHL
ncbi:MAG: hypothetical protein ACTHZ1_14040, partial [Sphingobacterium sp.]